MACRGKMLYAGDLIVIAESEQELIKNLKRWKDGVQHKGE